MAGAKQRPRTPRTPEHAWRALQLPTSWKTLWPALLVWTVAALIVRGPAVTVRVRVRITETQQDTGTAGAALRQALSDQQLPAQGGRNSSQAAGPLVGGQQVASSLQVHTTPDSNGNLNKYYYSFHNIQLSREKLQFFTSPGFQEPPPLWVDFIGGNATGTGPPTVLVIKGEGNPLWHYLPVEYTPAASQAAQCKGWIEKPAYLLQVRHSHNIWHTWNEGLLGAFQTLREQDALPLVQIDENGNMRLVTEGLGKETCQPGSNATDAGSNCITKQDLVAICDPKGQQWCRPGVWSHSRAQGPLLLTYSKRSLKNKWAHLYRAMSEDIRGISELEGWCFRRLLVGKTTTLNYYQPIKDKPSAARAQAERAEALQVFTAFIVTAQREQMQKQAAKKASAGTFTGYGNPSLDRLRRGIGPEDINLAQTILPFEAAEAAGPEVLHRLWKKVYLQQTSGNSSEAPPPPLPLRPDVALLNMDSLRADAERAIRQNSMLPAQGGASEEFQLESPRPVVTYMTRQSFCRAVLNEHEVLQYILSRYNITLRVTTLQEPLLELMGLLQHTDVLISMHGAGWTNLMFLKQRSTAVQLFPYGWQLPSGKSIRGNYYREIVLANRCNYLEWFNPNPGLAFFRKEDLKRVGKKRYLHPPPEEPRPVHQVPGPQWVYQNTYVDLKSFGPVVDEAMQRAGIPPMPHWREPQEELGLRQPELQQQRWEKEGQQQPKQQEQQQRRREAEGQQQEQQQQRRWEEEGRQKGERGREREQEQQEQGGEQQQGVLQQGSAINQGVAVALNAA